VGQYSGSTSSLRHIDKSTMSNHLSGPRGYEERLLCLASQTALQSCTGRCTIPAPDPGIIHCESWNLRDVAFQRRFLRMSRRTAMSKVHLCRSVRTKLEGHTDGEVIS